ncbi:MAG TPA: hypothetical protein VGJ91_17395 [Polyangiaceae bacterium]
MSEPPDKPSGSRHYLPPPPDGSAESVDVPRMEPPPASLEAMVRSQPGAPLAPARQSSWVWVLLTVIAIAAIAYYLGLRQ